MELDKAREIIEEVREYYLQPVIQRDKRWKTRAEALQYCLSFLKSLKEMELVVPEKRQEFTRFTDQPIIMNKDFNECRSQLLLGLVGFANKLPEIIDKWANNYYGIDEDWKKDLSQAILNELGKEK